MYAMTLLNDQTNDFVVIRETKLPPHEVLDSIETPPPPYAHSFDIENGNNSDCLENLGMNQCIHATRVMILACLYTLLIIGIVVIIGMRLNWWE